MNILSNKWVSLTCVFINSTLCYNSLMVGEWEWACISFGFAWICAHNFLTALKEEQND